MSEYVKYVTLKVPVFVICEDGKEQAHKVLEEAAEAYGAWSSHVESMTGGTKDAYKVKFAKEVFDCIQACVNLAARYELDLDDAAAKVTCDNIARGRLPTGTASSITQYFETVGKQVERIRFRGGQTFVAEDVAETNYDKWLGSPNKAAHAISCLVDHMEDLSRHLYDGRDLAYHSNFTDALHDESPFALVHTSTLLGWLKHEAGGDAE